MEQFLVPTHRKKFTSKELLFRRCVKFPGSHKKFENAVNDFHRLKTSFTSCEQPYMQSFIIWCYVFHFRACEKSLIWPLNYISEAEFSITEFA